MNYYFVGIKGSGMSALAQIYKDLGHNVKGCDVSSYVFTQDSLENKNITIETFENMQYEDFDVIIIGNAFSDKYNFANKKTLNYQQALSELCNNYYSIAICGTHGKTTTTNMVRHILSKIGKVSYLVGDGNGKAYKDSKYFVFEACEHRDHFLSYNPNMVVCVNIDYDHVEYFKDKKQYKKSFETFFSQAKDKLVLSDTISYKHKDKLSFGINNGLIKASNVKYTQDGIVFDLIVKDKLYDNIFLPFYGKHVLLDSLAAISCCYSLGIDVLLILKHLQTYSNANRRYNISFFNSNVIIDDYGHHPKEIMCTVNAIQQEFIDKSLIIIYHPDRVKRLLTFKKEYEKVFNEANMTYILPFINNSTEEKQAIKSIVNNNKIKEFDESFYKIKYKNVVFLFTGSKDMSKIIYHLKENL